MAAASTVAATAVEFAPPLVLAAVSGMVRIAAMLVLPAEKRSVSRQSGSWQLSAPRKLERSSACFSMSNDDTSPATVSETSTTVDGTATTVSPSASGEKGGSLGGGGDGGELGGVEG